MKRFRILLASLFLVATTGLAAASTTTPAPTQDDSRPEDPNDDITSLFGDILEVEVVNVDVFVTDKQGRPVPNLSPEDFEVLEDGQPVEVTNFRYIGDEVRTRVVPAPTPETPEAEPPAEVLVEEDPEPVAEREPFHLILYVDHAFLRSTNRHRVLRDLRQLARNVDPETRILVASHARSLKIDLPFTTDTSRVTDALNAMELRTAFGNDAQNRFMDLLRDIEDTRTPPNRIENQLISYAQELQQNVQNGLDSIRLLIESLSGLPGRKALVYAADGLPLTPAEELFNAFSIRFSDVSILGKIMNFNASREFHVLAQHANTADVAFYAVHAAGLEAPLGSSAEISGSGIDEIRPTVDSVRTANFQGSGRLLAGETGGLAILNTNDFSAGLARMLQDFSTHYSLGYHPKHGRDERYHSIEVRVKGRRDLEVRHRRGYRDRSLANRLKDSVVASLQHGVEDNPFEVTIRTGAARPSGEEGRGNTLIQPFTVGIPMAQLVLVPRETSHEGRVKIYLSVLDEKGQSSTPEEVTVPISIPNEAIDRARTQSWNQEVQLLVRPGAGLIAVGVWDEIGRTWSVLRRSYESTY